MCLICADLKENKLTSVEARRNLGETYKTLKRSHVAKILRLIWQKEDEELTDVGSD